jgi:alpha-amylase
MKAITLYLHAHQPWRIRSYNVTEMGVKTDYFEDSYHGRQSNERIIHKVAEKCYRPMNKLLLELCAKHEQFRFSLSITGTLIEQLRLWAPDVLDDFKKLSATGKMEIVAETYHHSLAFFFSKEEFETQVQMHKVMILEEFGQTPTTFRNTEFSYNNELGQWAAEAGYKAILTEGWDPVLAGRTSNHVYETQGDIRTKLLMKNYKLSDDIAFRFSNRSWESWPLTVDKFNKWANDLGLDYERGAETVNLFMDYETFGEHQWADTGIFDFMRAMPEEWLKTEGNTFMTTTQASESFESCGQVDVPNTITWADTERDLTAWLGNRMQHEASHFLYDREQIIKTSGRQDLLDDWRKLTTSDNFYFMCTKWFSDGDVHAYFSPYESPYDGFMYFMNAARDVVVRAGGGLV